MARRSQDGRIVPVIVMAIAVAAGLASGARTAAAVDRCVLMEEFTATWCEPCHVLGDWLSPMQDANPDSLALLQEHVSGTDAFAIPWGKSRFANYPNTAEIPTVYYDGTDRLIGTLPGPAGYQLAFDARRAIPTDVTIELGAQPLNGQAYKISARVGVTEGGTAKTAWIYIVRALDHYPTGYTYNRNCLMEAATVEVLDLVPGERQVVERTMTFDAASWAQPSDIRVFAWAQTPGNTGYREVFQAKQIAWPLLPLYPVGDANCDGYVSYADINPFVLALQGQTAYQSTYPNCNWLSADCNGDGTVSYADINAFVTLLSGTLPPFHAHGS